MVIPLKMGYSESLAEWLSRPSGIPPIITRSFASENLFHNGKWKIYLEANNPEGSHKNRHLPLSRPES
jgi:hypothetical protein